MKNLKQYIEEKLVVFHPQIDEKLVLNKNYRKLSSRYIFRFLENNEIY